jgi:hypothetical protein
MSAAQYDLVIEQGTTFQRDFTWKTAAGVAIPLTGYTIRLMARINPTDAVPVISLTTPATGITITSEANGTFQILLSAAITAGYAFTEAQYDLEAASPAATPVVTRLMEGTITISPERTK